MNRIHRFHLNHKCLLILMLLCILLPADDCVAKRQSGEPGKGLKGQASAVNYVLSSTDFGSELFIYDFDALDSYKSFSLSFPKRFVVDVSGVKILKGFEKLEVNRPELTRVRIAYHRNKVRFVFDLPEGSEVQCRVQPVAEGLSIAIEQTGHGTLVQEQPEEAQNAKLSPLPKGNEPKKSPNEKFYTNQKISVDFYNAKFKDFFDLVTAISGVKFKLSPDLQEHITMKLQNMPWDQALETFLNLYQLDMKLKNGVFFIFYREDRKRPATADEKPPEDH